MTIRKRKDGRWEGRYTFAGKQKSIYGDTKEEIQTRLNKIDAEIELETHFEPSVVKLGEWLNVWLFDFKKKEVKPKTFESYEQIIRLYLSELDIKIKDLSTVTIQRFINNMKLSPRTIKYTYTVLNMALEHAVKLRYIQYNPAEHVKIPKQIKKQIKYLDKDNLNKFISSIKSHRLYAAFYLAVTSGIRRGELLALRWSDISFSDATMNIQRTVNRIKVFDDDEPHYKLVEGSPKSDKSIRILPILPDILDALKKHKSRQKQEILKCDDYKYNNLVFCNTNGTPLNPRNFAKHFYNVLSRNDITKINFHALRHTYATVGLQNGIELKVMQELLGHSSLSVTADTYTHVVLDQKKTEINKLKNAF